MKYLNLRSLRTRLRKRGARGGAIACVSAVSGSSLAATAAVPLKLRVQRGFAALSGGPPALGALRELPRKLFAAAC